MPILFLLSGPSGVGKTTLVNGLRKLYPGLGKIVTATTRAPRLQEKDDYIFLSQKVFEEKIQEGAFYEYAKVYGQYYGSLKSEIQKKLAENSFILLDVQGAQFFMQSFRQEKQQKSRLVSIFVTLAQVDDLRIRLVERREKKTEIDRRLGQWEQENQLMSLFNYVIQSKDREQDLRSLQVIFLAEQLRNHTIGDSTS